MAEQGAPITHDQLRQLRILMDEGVGGYSLRTVSAVVAKLDEYRDRLRDAENDLLNVRGTLSPNGSVRRVPVPLAPTVAPAVEWLANEVDRLRAVLDRVCEHEFPPPTGPNDADDYAPGDCARCGMTYAEHDHRFGERMAEALEGGA